MHTNLNNPSEQQIDDPQPILLPTSYLGPSPQLSPIQLTLLNPDRFLESSHFRLEIEPNLEHHHFNEAHIDDLSYPLPHPTDEFMMDFDKKQQAEDQHLSEQTPLFQIKREKDPSLKLIQTIGKPVFTLQLPQKQILPIRAMIQFLVQNSCIDEATLIIYGKQFYQENSFVQNVIKILVRKFKNLQKTKQEMIKYCMRKAFKFIADRMKRDRTHNRDVDNCMKQYFSKNQGGNTFSIPFKKNSVQKTMNGNFLKKVFTSTSFAEDYSLFLKQLRSLIAEDNDKKILYLADFIDKCIKTNDLRKVEAIKRLPWTKETLIKTEKLGFSLSSYADEKREKQEDS